MNRIERPATSAICIYQVEPSGIHYLKFILEGYDGLATLSTVDPRRGLIQVVVPPGCQPDLEALLEALGRELKLERVVSEEACQQAEGAVHFGLEKCCRVG